MALFLRVCDTYELLQEQLILNLKHSFQKKGVSALTPIPVIVPNLGIGRAIRQALAQRNGIDANVSFGYLAEWTWTELKRLDPDFRSIEGLQGDALTWRLDSYLGDEAFIARFPRLQQYVQEADRKKRWQLAERIALTFTRYNAYRLDWVQAWIDQRHPDEKALIQDPEYAWQKAFWERLGKELELAKIHPADALYQNAQHFSTSTDLHVFIPQNVPPLYLRLMARLSCGRDVYVYLKNPCSQFWLDIQKRSDQTDESEDDPLHLKHLEGHPLLASWARQTKSMYELFYSYIDEGQIQTENLFYNEKFLKEDYEPSTNLERLQHSIAKLDCSLMDGMQSHESDRTLEIHDCYGSMREVDALRDYLYALFESDPTLKASDVLVMTPDIDRMAPMIDAVFGTVDSAHRIDYQIQGRAVMKHNDCAKALSLLMKLFEEQITASATFLLFSNAAVSRHFGFENDLGVVRRYFDMSGFRMGMDPETLERHGLASVANFSFQRAIDRLFISFAKPDHFQGVVDQLIPVELAYGQRVPEKDVLCSLANAFMALEALHRAAQEPRSLQGWGQWLTEALIQMVGDEDLSVQRIECLNVIDRMIRDYVIAGIDDSDIPLSVVRRIFERHFADASAGATPAGGVTFTNMNSLHGLSYRVVCILNLNEGVFPSSNRPDDFDLMGRYPRAGDRQRMLDDRNTFFDWLMDAQEYLYLSFSGRNNKDGSEQNPSILIDEMLDAITMHQSSLCQQDEDARHRYRQSWVLRHPIHAFSLENFDANQDLRLIGRDGDMHAWLNAAQQEDVCPIRPFWLPNQTIEYVNDSRRIRLQDFIRFWMDPLAYMWKQRLMLCESEEIEALKDREHYCENGLETWGLKDRFLTAMLEKRFDETSEMQYARCNPSIVVAPVSDAVVEKAMNDARKIYEEYCRLTGDAVCHSECVCVQLALDGEKWVIEGEIDHVFVDHLIECSASRFKSKYFIKGLIQWAMLQTHRQAFVDYDLVMSDRALRGTKSVPCFMPTPSMDTRGLLTLLLKGYREGQSTPLILTPGSLLMGAWPIKDRENLLKEEFKTIKSDFYPLLKERGSEADFEWFVQEAKQWSASVNQCMGWE